MLLVAANALRTTAADTQECTQRIIPRRNAIRRIHVAQREKSFIIDRHKRHGELLGDQRPTEILISAEWKPHSRRLYIPHKTGYKRPRRPHDIAMASRTRNSSYWRCSIALIRWKHGTGPRDIHNFSRATRYRSVADDHVAMDALWPPWWPLHCLLGEWAANVFALCGRGFFEVLEIFSMGNWMGSFPVRWLGLVYIGKYLCFQLFLIIYWICIEDCLIAPFICVYFDKCSFSLVSVNDSCNMTVLLRQWAISPRLAREVIEPGNLKNYGTLHKSRARQE